MVAISHADAGSADLARSRLLDKVDRVTPWLLVVAIIALWETVIRFGLLDVRDVSRPQDVAVLVWDWIVTGSIFAPLAQTLFEVVVGYVCGTLLGLMAAFLFFFYPAVGAYFEKPMVLLNAIPRAILAPLVVLVLGFDSAPKIILVILVVSVITLVNLLIGLREVDSTIVNNARVLGANRRELTWHVYIPAALVWIIAAMRSSVGHAFTAAIICELIAGTSGLGSVIAVGQTAIRPDWVMAGLFFASIVVMLIDLMLLAPLERRSAHWRVF